MAPSIQIQLHPDTTKTQILFNGEPVRRIREITYHTVAGEVPTLEIQILIPPATSEQPVAIKTISGHLLDEEEYAEFLAFKERQYEQGHHHAHSTGVNLILTERLRQILVERYSAEMDDRYNVGELASAAVAYLTAGSPHLVETFWPWSRDVWKPKSRLKNLIRAGALIAAEIDRLIRKGEKL